MNETDNLSAARNAGSDFYLENINERNIKNAAAFIKRYEKMAMGLSSQFVEALTLLKKGRVISAKRIMGTLYMVRQNEEIFGLFALSTGGTLFHCFPSLWQACNFGAGTSAPDNEDFYENAGFADEKYFLPLKKLLQPLFVQNQVYGMIGEARSTAMFAAIFGRKPSCQRTYFFMEQLNSSDENSFLDQKLQNAVQFCPCAPKDKEKLYLLQQGYEIEEVLPPGSEHDPESCLKNLEIALKKQQVFAIYVAGAAVAKTGTNAQGFNHCQIGGVYTLPNYRGKGLAGFGICRLCSVLKEQNKKPVLFVKTHNLPAQKAYLKAGFVFTGKFNIFYF
ncbi:MAG: GNAT family N-acetyltransferase [Treponemataceae bacterium]|nr:GNAT family N-acetyltransferase [Treponemataceae bacterium]